MAARPVDVIVSKKFPASRLLHLCADENQISATRPTPIIIQQMQGPSAFLAVKSNSVSRKRAEDAKKLCPRSSAW
jgi:hypothetical protein